MELNRAVGEKTENYRTEKQLRDFFDSLTYDINAAEQDMRKLVNRVCLVYYFASWVLLIFHFFRP